MNQKLPKHVAIVMDGNGRWAEARGLSRIEGHRAGVEAVKMVVRACLAKKIELLSLFAFSSENWSRPEGEVDALMKGFVQAMDEGTHELQKEHIRLVFAGDREALSPELRSRMQTTEAVTCHNKKLTVNLALNYSGKWDIIQAVKKIAVEVEEGRMLSQAISEGLFAKYLSTHPLPDPDLFIRTSGEQRISNFFLWQLAYTELYFSAVHWPDFSAEEFDRALESYAKRERRFGLTSKQLIEGCDV